MGGEAVARTPVSWPPQDVVGGVAGKWAEASALPLGCDSGKSLLCREPFMLTWNSPTEQTHRLRAGRESRARGWGCPALPWPAGDQRAGA